MLSLLYIIIAPTPHPWPQTNVLPAPLMLQTSQRVLPSPAGAPPTLRSCHAVVHLTAQALTLSRAVPPLPPIITSCSLLLNFLVWIIQEGRKFITFFSYFICSLRYQSYYHLLAIRTCRDYMFAQSHKTCDQWELNLNLGCSDMNSTAFYIRTSCNIQTGFFSFIISDSRPVAQLAGGCPPPRMMSGAVACMPF